MNFLESGLRPEVIAALNKMGISSPTEIQSQVLPLILNKRPVMGLSKTGTGKTYAYVLPMVSRFYDATPDAVILVLVPTRELASQVAASVLAVDARARPAVVVGGEAEQGQVNGCHNSTWWIATPGRLLDLMRRREIPFERIQVVIFDEADRLLDMGFVDDMRAIRRMLPKSMELHFFSATLNLGVEEIAYEFGVDFERVGTSGDHRTVEGLNHQVSSVGDHEKLQALVYFLRQQGDGRGIVFCNYRDKAHALGDRLRALGENVQVLTAQLPQNARTKIMNEFRAGTVRVLLASDLASRGLDVDDVDFVVNVDLPEDPATYVHRVGRTARAGRQGFALSLIGFDDAFRLSALESYLGKKIQKYSFPDGALEAKLHRREGAIRNQEETTRVATGPQKVPNVGGVRSSFPKRSVGTKTPANTTKSAAQQGWLSALKRFVMSFFRPKVSKSVEPLVQRKTSANSRPNPSRSSRHSGRRRPHSDQRRGPRQHRS